MVKGVALLGSSEGVTGTINFNQEGNGPTTVTGTLSGLKPGLHGYHVHALGDTTNGQVLSYMNGIALACLAFGQEDLDLECPIEIAALVGEEYLFKMEVKDKKSGIFEQSYRVRRLTKDAETLKLFKAKVVDSKIDPGCGSENGSGFSGHSAPSLLHPQKLVSDLSGNALDGYRAPAASGELEQNTPDLVELAKKSTASYKTEDSSGKGKGIATPSKRNSAEVVESGQGDHNLKLLKSVKIEKP